MSREDYNACMVPYMTGNKTKEERQHDMCVGAKICSGKAVTVEEAEKLCAVPKLPKWAKQNLPKDEGDVSCESRLARVNKNIDTINERVKVGNAESVLPQAAQVLNDLFTCLPEPAIVEIAKDAMETARTLSKGFYFKGEGKNLKKKLELLKEVSI